MSKTVLIVEKDVALMRTVAQSLTGRGVKVEESTDGKGSPDLIRRTRPDCVVLAVDLDAGQNGYILCKKLKSDDELKTVPVIIIGDPKGFAQHQKLKTRAEDYVGKPLAVDQLVDAVGKIVGFPEQAPAAVDNGSFDPGSLLDGDGDFPVEEVVLDANTGEQAVTNQAADFDMVDAMFDDAKPAPETEPAVTNPAAPMGLGASDFDGDERTVVGYLPPGLVPTKPPASAPVSTPRATTGTTKVHAFSPMPNTSPTSSTGPGMASADGGSESRELRAKVTELSGSLDESQRHSNELESRVRELETELETKQTELETARTAGSSNAKSDKDVFALRDSVNKKDKEILRLKSELNDKEKEIVELREKENTFDQTVSEAKEETSKRDAQIKTLQTKVDQLTLEKKRVDTQLSSAKEEARASGAKLSTLQGDFEALQARNAELETELEPLRSSRADLEAAKGQLETELSEVRTEAETTRSQLDERSRETDDLRAQLDAANAELESARSQVSGQAQAFADEISGLRSRVSELETESTKSEERAHRSLDRVKAHQEQAERVRQALQMAMGHLESPPGEVEELDIDEIAEA
jgi:DNA-binding response OmpR family regulator/predicted  nucleic acid-binding Zn-ribbon protein